MPFKKTFRFGIHLIVSDICLLLFLKLVFFENLFLDESGVKDKLFFIHPTKFKITQKPCDTNMCSNEKLIFPEK